MKAHSHGHVLGGALLIAATTIGVGMLALPIATGPGGFAPSVFIYVVCWAFMLCTGLLLLEVCSWMPPDANFITMTHKLLGNTGRTICWFVYLFLFEMMMIAHIVSGGQVVSAVFSELGLIPSTIFYTILFSPIIYLGTKAVDRLNLVMFSGVLISYILFLLVATQHINFANLEYVNWSKAWLALPILFTAFTYQVILPTLVTYMKRDFKKIRKSLFFGTTIPLVVYLIWQVLILGIIPVEGDNGLLEAAARGDNAVLPLKHFVPNQWVVAIGRAFGFFAMTTSYIALALAFLDFLADGLKVKKIGIRKAFLCLVIFAPALIVSVYNPTFFLKALGFAGGVSCAILFGLYPPLMVWVGRYRKHYEAKEQLPGGRVVLFLLIVFIVVELGIELLPHFA